MKKKLTLGFIIAIVTYLVSDRNNIKKISYQQQQKNTIMYITDSTNKGAKNTMKAKAQKKVAHKKKPITDYLNQNSSYDLDLEKQKKQNNLFKKMLEDERNIIIAQSYLSDLSHSIQYTPTSHPYLRVFFIDFLCYAAQNGYLSTLETTLIQALHNYSPKHFLPGAEEDLIDLLDGWITGYGENKVKERPEIIFDTFLYTPRFRKIFATALGYTYQSESEKKIFLPFMSGKYL